MLIKKHVYFTSNRYVEGESIYSQKVCKINSKKSLLESFFNEVAGQSLLKDTPKQVFSSTFCKVF